MSELEETLNDGEDILEEADCVVDCVVGDQEQCDATGTWIRNHAMDAVCGGRCGAACSCREVQIRLIVRKMKSQFRSQWDRVEAAFKPRC